MAANFAEPNARGGIVFQLTAHLARVAANALLSIKKDQTFIHSDFRKDGSGMNASKGLLAHRKSLGRPRLMDFFALSVLAAFHPVFIHEQPYYLTPEPKVVRLTWQNGQQLITSSNH
jgi:hypothetical protein